jgi:hypothetical protein
MDLHLACVTSKNCYQQEALPSVTKRSEIGVVNSGKGIVVKLLKDQMASPIKIVIDKLRSYSAAKKALFAGAEHSTSQYENNRCELSPSFARPSIC